jgi:molybdopterin molybdotransferase
MLGFEEARAALLSKSRLVSSERIALASGAGRVLAQDLVAHGALPPFDHSAMDGYAVAVSDLVGDGPWVLPVLGESRAGGALPALAARSACRIFTGARLPQRADSVVAQENGTREGDVVTLAARPSLGQHVRRMGEDLPAGSIALPAGARLTAGALALAGMVDRADLVVSRRPRVCILCVGDELRAPGCPGVPGTIPESNSGALVALAQQAGALVRVCPITADEPELVERAMEGALETTDVLLTVGGVSVGDHDVVRPALQRVGLVLDFWKVAIKPGKPLLVGTRGAAHVLGLPGNPASAIVTFALFGMPLVRTLQGDSRPLPMPLRARLASRRARSRDRMEFVRASLLCDDASLVVAPHDNQASGAATSLAASDGLAVLPPGPEPLPPGAFVDFIRWVDL